MFILSLIIGCDDHEFSGGHKSGGETTGEGYEAVQSIFSNNCTSCHSTGGTFPPLDRDLCTDIVGVASQQNTSGFLVVADDSNASYLYHKIVGTHMDVGGSGSQMPLGGSLAQSDIDMIATWIDDGASCVASSESSTEPSTEPTSEPDDSGTPEPTAEPSEEPSEEPTQIVVWSDIEPLLSVCTGCHASTYPMMTYEDLVDQDSQQSSLKLVSPGDSANSYLFHKLSGTQADVGGNGSQMPLGGTPFSAENLLLVETWIDQGALLEPPPEPGDEPVESPQYTVDGFCSLYLNTCGAWENTETCEDWYNALDVGSYNDTGNPTDQNGATQSCAQYHLVVASTKTVYSEIGEHCGHVGAKDEADARCYDSDGDGVLNYQDAFHLDSTETVDTDEDGLGDNTDPDVDGDGICDTSTTASGVNTSDDEDCDGSSNAAESFCAQYIATCTTWPNATSCEAWFDAAEVGTAADTTGANQACYQHHLDIASSGSTSNPEAHCIHAAGGEDANGSAPCAQ